MKKLMQPTVLASFRVADNVLTHIADNTYRMNGKLTQNSDLDSISAQLINLLTYYLDENFTGHNIVIRLDKTVETNNRNDVPLNTLILAESESAGEISEDIKNGLCSVINKFLENILNKNDDMFTKNASEKTDIFTPEQTSFIGKYSTEFIEKSNGKPIKKPFLCVISGKKTTEVPVQGTFKPPFKNNTAQKDDETFFAHSNGTKPSDMLIFLKRLDATNTDISVSSKDYIAEQHSHTKIAAAALANSSLLVKVVSYEKPDTEGKSRLYIRHISIASIEDLGVVELKLTS